MTGTHAQPPGRQATPVETLPPFAALPAEVLLEMEAMRRVRRFEAGRLVFAAGVPPREIGLVHEGILRLQRTMMNGRQHIGGLLIPGDIFGRVFDGAENYDVEAATMAEIWCFPRAPFEALLQRSPALERVVMLTLLNELDRTRQCMMILSSRKVTERVAGFLLMLCSCLAALGNCTREKAPGGSGRHGDGPFEISVPIARADVSNLLGSRPESISRALHALENQGVIEILTPDRFRVLDLDALVAQTGEEEAPAVPHLLPRVTSTLARRRP